jgi:cytochrome P450
MMRRCSAIHTASVNGTLDPDGPRTIIHDILESDLQPTEKSFQRILEEVGTVTGAAFETTANSIRMTLFHINKNPTIRQRLRAELASCKQQDADMDDIGLSELERLPYLTAVLMEGLRLSPAIATRATRVAPDRDLIYGKWVIPAGTPIGMTAYFLLRDPELYPNPDEFNPERWMDMNARRKAERSYAPFSKGPRNCLGMQ